MINMEIRQILFLIILIQFGCGNKISKHYKYVNKANEHLINKDFKSAFNNFEKADKIKNSLLFQFNLNAYLTSCFSGEDADKQNKYFTRVLDHLDCKNYVDLLSSKRSIVFENVKDKSFQDKNLSSRYLDSLLERDQFNRNTITFIEKKKRDSLHLLNFIQFSKEKGFPHEFNTRINCFTSGTGSDLYRLNLLLLHFREFENTSLDSLLQNEFVRFKISPEIFANCNSRVRNLTKFSYCFLFINETLYINDFTLKNKSKINKTREEYGIPSIKLEYLLIKNQSALQQMGFLINVKRDYVNLPNVPDGFVSEDIFKNML